MAETSFVPKAKNFFSKHPIVGALLTMCLIGLVLIWLLLIFLDIWTHHGDDSTVPEIKHLTYNEAKARLAESNLEIEISDSIYDTSLPAGTIV